MCSNNPLLASLYCCSLVVLVAITIPPSSITAAAEEFVVGGAVGWRRPDLNHTQLYDQWASNRRFHVGDSIRFEYKNDSVVEVEKWAYYHCDGNDNPPPLHTWDDGNTMVNLDRIGSFYFISGDVLHCIDGQRLHVDVLPLHGDDKPHNHSNSQSVTIVPFNLFSYVMLLAFNVALLYLSN